MSEDHDTIAVRLRIHGRVQGVWFRGWTARTAEGLGIRGWVRNRTDGTVEAVLVGTTDDVETMIEKCRSGPPDAKVEKLERDAELPSAHLGQGFSQLPTE